MSENHVRIDAWIWAVRLAKTRTLATAACKAGHVRINDERAKPASPVVIGDTVRAWVGERERVVEVTGLLVKRVSATVAATCYIDHSPPAPARLQQQPKIAIRERGSGRPTKQERRQLDKLRGHRPN